MAPLQCGDRHDLVRTGRRLFAAFAPIGLAHGLYLVALVKLITPPLIAVGVVRFPSATGLQPSPTDGIATDAISTLRGIPPADALTAVSPTWAPWFEASIWVQALAILWVTGGSFMLVRAALRSSAAARWVLRQRRASQCVQDDVQALGRQLGIKSPPPVVVADAEIPPMLCPTWRGLRIVVPARLLAVLNTASRRTVLAHELAHVRRLDWLVRGLEVVVHVVWWWFPLVTWIRRGLRRTEELCCDAVVVRCLPDHRREYACALIAAASGASAPPLACAIGDVQRIEERMERIMTKRADRLGVCGRLAILALALVSWPLVACRGPKPENPSPIRVGQAFVTGHIKTPAAIDLSRGAVTLLAAATAAEPLPSADMRPGRRDPFRRVEFPNRWSSICAR